MINRFLYQHRFALLCISLSALCALLLFSIERISLFNVVKEVPVQDLRDQKPFSISANIYLTGKCKMNLYGWTYLNPGPTDGADQYIEVRRLNATLDSSQVDAKKDKFERTGVNEHFWTLDIPSRGLLKLTFQDYEAPRDNLLDTTFHLDCNRPWSRATWLSLLAVSILSGMVGFIFVLISAGRRVMRKLKP